MKCNLLRRALVLGLSVVGLWALGCGGGNQLAPPPEGPPKSAVSELREWVQGVAETGELDSFVEEGLPEAIEELKSEGVSNVDEIEKLANELAAASSPAEVKAKAKALLEKLPQDGGGQSSGEQ